jgi:RNA polymerase sigma-70 factor (ECF subfamily)
MHFRLRTRQRQQWTRKEDAQPDWSVVVDALADEHSEISKLWNHEHDTYLVKRLLELVSKEFSLSTMEAFQRVVLRGEDVTAVAQSLQMTPNAVRIAQSRVLAALRRVGAGLID